MRCRPPNFPRRLASSIDDGWQACNSGPGGKGFHNASGFPIFDQRLFPDMQAMVALGTKLGLIPGFYVNNCQSVSPSHFLLHLSAALALAVSPY